MGLLPSGVYDERRVFYLAITQVRGTRVPLGADGKNLFGSTQALSGTSRSPERVPYQFKRGNLNNNASYSIFLSDAVGPPDTAEWAVRDPGLAVFRNCLANVAFPKSVALHFGWVHFAENAMTSLKYNFTLHASNSGGDVQVSAQCVAALGGACAHKNANVCISSISSPA
jgi:hypothetical protein